MVTQRVVVGWVNSPSWSETQFAYSDMNYCHPFMVWSSECLNVEKAWQTLGKDCPLTLQYPVSLQQTHFYASQSAE